MMNAEQFAAAMAEARDALSGDGTLEAQAQRGLTEARAPAGTGAAASSIRFALPSSGCSRR